jgi:hypothetical protein
MLGAPVHTAGIFRQRFYLGKILEYAGPDRTPQPVYREGLEQGGVGPLMPAQGMRTGHTLGEMLL